MFEKSNTRQANGSHGINPLAKRLYTLKEAAAYLGRSEWGMRELIWGRKIPVVRECRKIYLDIDDLEDFVRQNKTLYN